MKYDINVFSKQYRIAQNFIIHLMYYRILHNAYSNSGIKSAFWQYTIDSHVLQATVNWCKIFGSDNCNDTHWKKLNIEHKDLLKESFIEGLSNSTGMNLEQWKQYWNEMTNFRNKYVAHSEIGFSAPVPNFGQALNIVYFYDSWVREIIAPDFLDGDSLKGLSKKLTKKLEKPLGRLVTNSVCTLDGN